MAWSRPGVLCPDFFQDPAQTAILRKIGIDLAIPRQILALMNERGQFRKLCFGELVYGTLDLCQTHTRSRRDHLLKRNDVSALHPPA